MGVLASRLAIADTVHSIDRYCSRNKIKPIFFHGSGGSTDRGGGPIEEQTSWWPRSALKLYKATLQGETIERSLASPEITLRRIEQITTRFQSDTGTYRGASPTLKIFASKVSQEYERRLHSPEFLQVVQHATSYPYLNDMKLGSRPSRRIESGQIESLDKLRAIPWVLCWTQTRVLFPTWWGVGTAWQTATARERALLRGNFKKDPFFRSFVKTLGTTLAKVEMPIWRIYLESSGLAPSFVHSTTLEFEKEYDKAVEMVRFLSGDKNLIGFKPWLAASIRLRAPMIHPLNLLQVIAIEQKEPRMIRETVAGIASGMMTTG